MSDFILQLMSLILRKQFPEFEIDEFTEEINVTPTEAIAEIKQFDWVSETLKSSKVIEEHAIPSIWLKNESGDTLAVSCEGDNRFVIFCRVNNGMRRSSHSIVNGYEGITELITLFDNREKILIAIRLKAVEHYKTPLLLDLMSYFVKNEKTRHSREILKEEFVYTIKYSRVLKKLLFSILILFFPSMLWFNPFQTRILPVEWGAFLIFQTACIALAIPALIITMNHLKKNKGWSIYFRKGDNTFIIISAWGKELFDKADFEKRIVTSNTSNAPWSEFDYNTLIRKDGKQLHISSILVPTSDMDKLFGRMASSTEGSNFQMIRSKKITN